MQVSDETWGKVLLLLGQMEGLRYPLPYEFAATFIFHQDYIRDLLRLRNELLSNHVEMKEAKQCRP